MSISSSILSRRVFVDTSAYYALTDQQDNRHADAQEIVHRLADERRRLFTTNFIIAETHALILVRLGRSVAAAVLSALDRSATTIIRVSAGDERRARAIIAQFDDKDFSLTDATSFAVMDRLRISQAFTFDRNFAQYGFRMVD
jgi:predicted nucleic acid-binding protein